MYEVIVLKEGYSIKEGPGQQKACGTITLLKGSSNVIVDTGNPWDKDLILEGLNRFGLTPLDISYVICTKAYSDKVGNLNLFVNAVQIVAGEVGKGDYYQFHGFQEIEVRSVQENWSDMRKLWELGTGLAKHSCSAEKIQYVVCTHGHSDHIGNLNLFPEAIHVVSHDICVGDQYMLHGFKQGIPYEINEDIEVVATPGHTATDVSVIVKNTANGTIAITGDLFECQDDLEDYTLWQENSELPELQEQSRINILGIADWIVPGHGAMFKVPEEYKRQMKVVMYYEYSSTKEGETKSESSIMKEYVVCEEDD